MQTMWGCTRLKTLWEARCHASLWESDENCCFPFEGKTYTCHHNFAYNLMNMLKLIHGELEG